LGGQIYKIFYSVNPLKGIIPLGLEKRAYCTAPSHWFGHTLAGYFP